MQLLIKKSFAVAAAMSVFLVACGGNAGTGSSPDPAAGSTSGSNAGSTGKEPVAATAPAKLNFFIASINSATSETITKLIKEKFPQHTFEITIANDIQPTIAAGTVPDIISYSLGGVTLLKDLQVLSDLTPLIEKHKFDLNRFLPGVVDAVKSYSDSKSEMLVMPFELNNTALFYNKNIFDKFGVPYPKDGMTWEELLEVAKKITRVEDGVQYKGFRFEETNILFRDQLGLTFVDPQTLKSTINTDPWKKWMQVMMAFYQIPGNPMNINVSEKDEFLKSQTLAMRTGPNFLSELPAAATNGLNFDFASLPHFAGEDKGSQMNAPYYAIPPASKNKDAAFEVIAYLLSDEVQTMLAKAGRIPIVKNENVIKEFGKGTPEFEGKNLQAFFKEKIAPPAVTTKYDTLVKTAMVKTAMRGVSLSNKDINTALRETEEEANKAITAAINK